MTRQVRVGDIKIGGRAPVVIQSMTKTDTRDIAATVRQVKELESAGCELVRVAVKDFQAAAAIKNIKKRIHIPLAADIHFDYRLALAAIENGADKIRLNPGNIHRKEQIIEVAARARKQKIPIRVGVNSGSIGPQADIMVKKVLDFIKVLEKTGFYDIIVSLKSSDIQTTIDANEKFFRKSDYPLHLGVTAAGPVSIGLVKSSVGIGALLLKGIGDTIRVSLTGHPCEEVIVAKDILRALNLRKFGPEIISCPTCGRCQVDLQGIVKKLAFSLESSVLSQKTLKIAVMGCEVNGPGEAKEADIGIAFGKGVGVLFKKGKIIKRVKEKESIKALMSLIVQS